MQKAILAIAAAFNCWAQDPNQDPRKDVTRHLENELYGQRLELDSRFVNSVVPTQSRSSSGDGSGSLISIRSAGHKIPKSARKAFDRATKHSSKRDYRAAAAELETAVALDPDFVEARANLGAQYIRLGRLDEARKELQRAVELDPNMAAVHANLAMVLLGQNHAELAIVHARRALKLAPANYRAHFFLGLALGASPSTLGESLEHLRIAAEQLPEARSELARVSSSGHHEPN
jgi:tetratricopeptide (TPR) repeat protein